MRTLLMVLAAVILPASFAFAAAPDEAAARALAAAHFDRGIERYDLEDYDGALAEFLASRAAMRTRAGTKNAALCLRRLERNAEALAMFKELLTFPDLPEADGEMAAEEIEQLRTLVGTVVLRISEPGAHVAIDGPHRGVSPVKPIAVNAGSHVVRVYKQGFETHEQTLAVAGGQTVRLSVALSPLTLAGGLSIRERTGKKVDVLVDNVVVGKTPWQGRVSPGSHVVRLRGDGNLGSAPVQVPVPANGTTALGLAVTELTARLRIEPTPVVARLALDGVSLGRGIWEGRLAQGRHRVEVAEEGFVARDWDVSLRAHETRVLRAELSRDPASPFWYQNRARFFVELDGAFGFTPSFNGDVAGLCESPCSTSPAIGFAVIGHGGYRFRSGVLVALQGGYLFQRQRIAGRPTEITPIDGSPPHTGVTNDTLVASGGLVGVAVGFHYGLDFPLTVRLGTGVVAGSLADRRSGTFTSPSGVAAYDLEVRQNPRAIFLYVAPGGRIAVSLGQEWELSLGLDLFVLVALLQPKWDGAQQIDAGGQGPATFGTQELVSRVSLVVLPGLGARYDF